MKQVNNSRPITRKQILPTCLVALAISAAFGCASSQQQGQENYDQYVDNGLYEANGDYSANDDMNAGNYNYNDNNAGSNYGNNGGDLQSDYQYADGEDINNFNEYGEQNNLFGNQTLIVYI